MTHNAILCPIPAGNVNTKKVPTVLVEVVIKQESAKQEDVFSLVYGCCYKSQRQPDIF